MTKGTGLSITHFLPYDPRSKVHGAIRVSLQEYATLLRIFLKAIESFHQQEMEDFDSLVGENACQVRAVMIAVIGSERIDFSQLEQKILHALENLEMLLEPKKIAELMAGASCLQCLILREGLDISLNHQELYVLQSYLLTLMKESFPVRDQHSLVQEMDAADLKKVKRFGEVSMSFAMRLLRKSRRCLARASVEFVREVAQAHPCKILKKMVSEEFTIQHHELPCTPMFWTYKAMIAEAKRMGVPLILHAKFLNCKNGFYDVVDEEIVLFETDQSGRYVPREGGSHEKTGWVVRGVVADYISKESWREAMRRVAIEDVILAGAADHRQYPDASLDASIESLGDREFMGYRAFARERGFSRENPSTFFIQHVYAARVGNFFKADQLVAVG